MVSNPTLKDDDTSVDTDGPSVAEHQALAARSLHPAAAAYFFGGAGCESALRGNESAFSGAVLVPRVLRPVGDVDTSSELDGLGRISVPFIVAPMALQTAAHRLGEIAVSRSARKCGVPMALSMLSGTEVDKVQPLMQQIYVMKDRALTLQVARRARAAGARVLLLTVDAPLLGRRLRDESAPPMPSHVRPAMLGALGSGSSEDGTALAQYFARNLDPNLTPNIVRWLAEESGMPVWVKGVIHPDDARICIAAGAKGIVVSNHGGRQVGSAQAPFLALEAVVSAVDGRVPVLVDSGVRHPEDVVKALALGASAGLLGRPVLIALAADGERGVTKLLREFASDVRLAMALCGATSVAQVTRDMVLLPDESRKMRSKL